MMVSTRNKDATTINGCLLFAEMTKFGSTPGGGWAAGVFEREYKEFAGLMLAENFKCFVGKCQLTAATREDKKHRDWEGKGR